MNIKVWLEKYKNYWLNKDIDSILELFDDNIEYRETPYDKYNNKNDVRNLWTAINFQEQIKLDLQVFSKDGDKYTIIWNLQYMRDLIKNNWKGVYLMEMENDKCSFFMQIGEKLDNEI